MAHVVGAPRHQAGDKQKRDRADQCCKAKKGAGRHRRSAFAKNLPLVKIDIKSPGERP